MQEQPIQPCFAITELHRSLLYSPGDIMVIDVRSKEEYNDRHIPAAVHVPLGELKDQSKEFPKNKQIVTTCGKGGGRSALGAAILKQEGFIHVSYLCGGTLGWFDHCNTISKQV
jgi:rhodanese-related sulfurtransferase